VLQSLLLPLPPHFYQQLLIVWPIQWQWMIFLSLEIL
jgi:hypothetical protein